jgi:glycosyltransferase involved in cell wall biosynthesis
VDEIGKETLEMDAQSAAEAIDGEPMQLSVVIPTRNEQDVLAACLASLVAQREPGWELGTDWELIVVDDHSTDATREIAEAVPGVTVLQAPALDVTATTGFTGKTNACWDGAQQAKGRLLLFTDADTLHEPGSLSRARHELEKYQVGMLSYSPRQVTTGILQKMLMPLVFAELSIAYPMKRVNDPADRTAAANGQFLLVQSDDYFAVGGHRGVGRQVLEDVALARAFKRQRKGLRFRYGPDALSTRMYRTTAAMMEGWTKNLALLFTSPPALAAMRSLDILLIFAIPLISLVYPFFSTLQRALLWVVWLRVIWRFYARVAKSNFPFLDCLLSVFGIPLFVYLLLQSWTQVKFAKKVDWKGRTYRTGV